MLLFLLEFFDLVLELLDLGLVLLVAEASFFSSSQSFLIQIGEISDLLVLSIDLI